MRVHGAVGQSELYIATGAASAALFPFGQFEAGEVRYEVGFPLVAARFDGAKLALAAEIAVFAYSILKGMHVFEDKADVMEQIQNDWQIRDGSKASRLAARAVVVLVPGVDGNAKKAAGAPFETVLAAVGRLDGCGTTTCQHVDQLVEKVFFGVERTTGRDLGQVA